MGKYTVRTGEPGQNRLRGASGEAPKMSQKWVQNGVPFWGQGPGPRIRGLGAPDPGSRDPLNPILIRGFIGQS